MTCRVAHAVSFLVLGIALIIAFCQLFSFSLAGVQSALLWALGGLLAAAATAKLGPALAGRQVACSSCAYSSKAWCGPARPTWRQVKAVEYESVMEVLIYYCSYRKTNCLTDTLYSGPRQLGFICRTVSAKVLSLNGSGSGSSIFTGCQAPGAR